LRTLIGKGKTYAPRLKKVIDNGRPLFLILLMEKQNLSLSKIYQRVYWDFRERLNDFVTTV